jgi:hypothetical protein
VCCARTTFNSLITRARFLYKLLLDLLIFQGLLAAAFLGFILLFALTWKPRMF